MPGSTEGRKPDVQAMPYAHARGMELIITASPVQIYNYHLPL